ncbi:hypothetical protein SAMN05444166_1079 [Singulisphaera sp. GP187]|nr:hypothetical protein SAMN05444166_1079 [Singulisphaera sp. GP187]
MSELGSTGDDRNNQPADADLAAQWVAENCPIIDGIVFGDGRIKQLFAVRNKQVNEGPGMKIQPGGWMTLADLQKKGQLDWTGILDLCVAEDLARGIRILGGEGGYGADGFVANIRSDSGEIVWIAFFTSSNPFEEVQIHSDHVLARTNLDMWWRFPLDAPEEVTLQ